MSKNRKDKRQRKDKRPSGIPTGIMRMDKELMSEISIYYSITNSIEATAKAYKVSTAMVEYALKNACSFNNLEKKEEE